MPKAKFFILILFVSLLIFPENVLALGIITQPIKIKDVLREQVIKERLSLNNSKDIEIIFDLGASGDIEGWVSYYNLDNPVEQITEIVVPAQGWSDVGVIIEVPGDTPNGEYVGFFTAFYRPELVEGEGKSIATVAQKFDRQVTVTVTDKEIILFKTRIFPESYALKENEPLKIKVIYNNKGNIAIKPQTQVKILDLENKKKELFNAVYPYPESEEPVKPLETKPIIITYPTNELKIGEYQALVVVSLRDVEQFKDDFVFVINESGQVLGSSVSSSISTRDKWFIVIFILILIFLALAFIFFRKAKKQGKSRASKKAK